MASKFYMVLDTEGVDTDHNGNKPNPATGLFYDLGYIVVEAKSGAIVKTFNAINADTMANVELMRTAYYADKLPKYYEAQANGTIETMSTLEIMREVRSTVREYGIKQVWAYNASYDKQITNSTVRQASNGFQPYFMPYSVEWRDIWTYAECITTTASYLDFVRSEGLVSAKGNPSTSADTVLKFLKGMDAVEQHTALSDCYDELVILLAAKGKHCKKSKKMGNGWRAAAKAYRERFGA